MANGGSIKYSVGFNVDKAGLNQIKASLQEIQRLTAQDLVKINNTSLDKANKDLKELQSSVKLLEGALDKAFNTDLGTLNVTKFNQELKKLNLNKIYQDFSNAGAAGQAAFRNTTAQILTTNMQLKQTHKLLDNMATTMANTIKWGVASGAMNSLTRSVQQAYGYVKSLDSSLNDIRIVTEKSSDEMSKFAVQANNAAKALGQSTTNYTDAALIYYQQGLSDEDVQARAETTLKAANVTGQTGEEVSEQLTAVWNGYKVTAEEAELYVDKLAAVAASTASDLEELSVGMSKVASAADLMGVDVDQLNATLATVVSVTRQAPESVGTAFKTIYARMGDIEAGLDAETTLGAYTEKMKEIAGIDVLNANKELRDMGEVVEEVGNKWTTLSREQQIALSQVMAGTRQYNNLLSLFDNWDMYTEALNTSANAAGTLQKQQDIYMESTAAHLAQLKASSEDLYDSLLDPKSINVVSDGLRLVIDLMSNFVDSIGGGAGVLLGLGSIGTKVFSQQLANGIATFIVNMRTAQDNVHQLEAEMEILSQFENANLNDSRTQRLVEMKRQQLDLNKAITTEERNISNEYIRQQNELYKQQDNLQQRLNTASQTYNQLTGESLDLSKEINRTIAIDEMQGRVTEYQREIETLNKQKKEYQNLTVEVNKYIAAKENENAVERRSQEEILTNLQKQEDALKHVTQARELLHKDVLSPKNQQELNNAVNEWNRLTEEGTKVSFTNKKQIDALSNVHQTLIKVYKEESKDLTQQSAHLKNYTTEVKANEEATVSLTQRWNQFIKTVDLRATVQNFISLTSSIGQVASGINSLSRINDIWTNENLSSGEKLLQTITNLGFALPMLANGISAVSKVTGISNVLTVAGTGFKEAYAASVTKVNLAEEKNTIIKGINKKVSEGKMTQEAAEIAIEQLHTTSATALTGALHGAAAGMKAFFASLGPIGWAVLAIGVLAGVVAIFDKITLSAEEAGEALDESLTSYQETENELKNLESQLESTASRLQELKDLALERDLTLVEQEELTALEAQNTALETQIELERQRLELKQKEVASSAKDAAEAGTYDTNFKNPLSHGETSYGTIDTGFLKLSDYGIEAGQNIDIYDQEGFDAWKEGMLQMRADAQKAVFSADNEKDAQKLQNVVDTITEDIQTAEEEWTKGREEALLSLGENYAKALEVLPSLIAQNTNGQYDDTIEDYKKIVEDYFNMSGKMTSLTMEGFDTATGGDVDRQKEMYNALQDSSVEEWDAESLKEIGFTDTEILKLQEAADEAYISLDAMVDKYAEIGQVELPSMDTNIEKIHSLSKEAGAGGTVLYEPEIKEVMTNLQGEYDVDDSFINKAIENIDYTKIDYSNFKEGFEQALREAIENQNLEDKANEVTDANKIIDTEAEKYELDAENVKDYAEHLREIAETSDEVDDALKDNVKATTEIAIANARLNKGLDDLADNWEDWEKILKSGEEGSYEYSKAMEGLGGTLEDILDIDDFGVLSNTFIADNLNDIKAAAEGSLDAVQRLMEAAAQDIIMNLELPQEELTALSTELSNFIATTNFDDLEVGATLDDSAFVNTLNTMLENADLTVADVETVLKAMRFDPEITYKEVPANTLSQEWLNQEVEIIDPKTGEIKTVTLTSEHMNSEDVMVRVPTINGSKTTYKGSPKTVASSPKRSSGGSKGGGGGGGGSKSSEPKKEKPLEDEIDRYHDVNVQLEQIEEELDDIGREQEKLFGKDLINSLNKELEILEKQRDIYLEKLEIARQEQKELQDELRNQGVQFNDDGTIANYASILQQKQDEINRLITQYNNTSADAQDDFKENTLDPAMEAYEEFKETLENYDNVLLETIPEIENAIQDTLDREVEIAIQKLNMEVELRLDLTEAQKDWNEFKREIIDGIDEDDIFGNALKDAELFETLLNNGTTEALTNNLQTTMDEINAINTTGFSDIFGTDKNAAIENLDEQMSNLMDHLTELADIEKAITEAYMDMIDEVGEAFDKQIESYEFVGDLIEHNMNMIQLLKGDDAYADLAKIYEEQEKNNLKQIESQKQAVEYYRQMMETETDPEALDEWTELWKDAVSDLNGLVEESVETIIDKYTNTINVIFDELNDKLTSGKGLEYLTQQWELQNENADQYLDTINSTYEIQKLERKIQESIDSSDSISAQRQLNKLMEDELKKLREKDKLTQYDVDRANQMYEIKLKEIALEEAQKNKSQMRLRRDASGNYSYQFVADQDSISAAQQELDDARNSLYNMDKDQYRENQQAILDVYTEFQEKMRNAANMSAEERALIEQEYTTRINNLLEENGYIRTNLMESAFADMAALYDSDIANFQSMSDSEKEILMNQIVPNWDSGIQLMIDKMAGEGGFGPTCENAFYQLDEATKQYNDSLALIEQTAGTTFEAMSTGYNENIELANGLADAQQENINRTIEEKDAIGELKTEVEALKTEYDNVYESAKKALEAAQALREAEKKAAAEAAAAEEQKRQQQQQNSGSGASGDGGSSGSGSSGDKSVSVSNIKIGDKLKYIGGTYYYDSSGMNPTGNRGAGKAVTVQNINKGAKYPIAVKSTDSAYGWLKENQLQKYDTGGYTGDWNGEEGKPAILHKKELVLNADDTKNFLSAIKIVRDMESILNSLNDSMLSRTTGMTSTLFGGYGSLGSSENSVNQNVQIQASFPGVSVRGEIEQAFENLVNMASQHAFNTQR